MPYADTTHRLYSEVQRHMLEGTIDNGVTWSLWTATEIHAYINQRIQRFLKETGILYTITPVAVPALNSTVSVPAGTIATRRLMWKTDGINNRTALEETDQHAQDNADPGWHDDTGVPYAYIEAPQVNTLEVTPVPTPDPGGVLTFYTTASPTALGAANVAIAIPAIFTPHIKWGVVADMLKKEGEANDPERAEHCEFRYQEGIDLARLMLGVDDGE